MLLKLSLMLPNMSDVAIWSQISYSTLLHLHFQLSSFNIARRDPDSKFLWYNLSEFRNWNFFAILIRGPQSQGKKSIVVYFDQLLGAAHSKCLLNYAFIFVLCKKAEKARNVCVFFLKFAPESWLSGFHHWEHVFMGIEPSTRVLVQTQKNVDLLNFESNFLFFFLFQLSAQNNLKSIIRPAFRVCSTQMLVKICNSIYLML